MRKATSLLLILGALSVQISLVKGNCNVCQANGAACINQTDYHLCFGGGAPDASQTFKCANGLVCTDSPLICFQRSEQPASCGDTDSCGRCNSGLVFACKSRTEFTFCFGATSPSNVSGKCPEGRFCDASSPDICVAQPTDNSIICHSD